MVFWARTACMLSIATAEDSCFCLAEFTFSFGQAPGASCSILYILFLSLVRFLQSVQTMKYFLVVWLVIFPINFDTIENMSSSTNSTTSCSYCSWAQLHETVYCLTSWVSVSTIVLMADVNLNWLSASLSD